MVFFDTIQGLRKRGHTVAEFSMHAVENQHSDYAKFFASEVALKTKQSLAKKWEVFTRMFRSAEIEYKVSELVKLTHPEVAHIHNAYRELSASTFTTLKKLHVPTVLTLHDVFALCPNHSLLRGEHLAIRELANKPFACFMGRCVNGSLAHSFAGMLEAYYYRYKKIWDQVDAFVCPSEFMKNLMVSYGFPAQKMHMARNPFTLAPACAPLGAKVVYLGRMHYEKGIKIFLQAAKELAGVPMIVAGTGPDDEWVNDYIAANKLSHIDRRGWVSGDAWQAVMREAKVIVVPSVFLENCSMTILEALSAGRIVVASDRGGNPELIINGKTGFLCKPEDPKDLARAIREAVSLCEVDSKKMIEAGREMVRKNHSEDEYFEKIVGVYKSVIV